MTRVYRVIRTYSGYLVTRVYYGAPWQQVVDVFRKTATAIVALFRTPPSSHYRPDRVRVKRFSVCLSAVGLEKKKRFLQVRLTYLTRFWTSTNIKFTQTLSLYPCTLCTTLTNGRRGPVQDTTLPSLAWSLPVKRHDTDFSR